MKRALKPKAPTTDMANPYVNSLWARLTNPVSWFVITCPKHGLPMLCQ